MARLNKPDSIDWLVEQNFGPVTKVPFTYKGKTFNPKPLIVSPLVFRDFNCPSGCGACCTMQVTLDYIPTETPPAVFEGAWRTVEFNGQSYQVFTDTQEASTLNHCKYLRTSDGRCSIHKYQRPDGLQPFCCDFAYLVFSVREGNEPNRSINRLPGRLHARTRVTDGGRGGKCFMSPYSKDTISELLRKLDRFEIWLAYFNMKDTIVPEFRKWIESGPHESPLYLNQEFASGSKTFPLQVLS